MVETYGRWTGTGSRFIENNDWDASEIPGQNPKNQYAFGKIECFWFVVNDSDDGAVI